MATDLWLEQSVILQEWGFPPNVEDDLLVQVIDRSKTAPKSRTHTCSVCLEVIDDDPPFMPCACPFFKVHRDCMPKDIVHCPRCKRAYECNRGWWKRCKECFAVLWSV